MANTDRDYRPFIPECTRRGIGRTTAFALAKVGMIETFKIGTRRYVYLDSLASLPERLKSHEAENGAAT